MCLFNCARVKVSCMILKIDRDLLLTVQTSFVYLLRPSKSTGQTQLDVLRDVIVQTFLFVLQPVSRALQVETKILLIHRIRIESY